MQKESKTIDITAKIHPVTRTVHLTYRVPDSAPDTITVCCRVRCQPENSWQPASIWPYISETARAYMEKKNWEDGVLRGRVTERWAAGLQRTILWNPFPFSAGNSAVDFQLTLLDGRRQLGRAETRIELNNADVVILNDWSQVIQQRAIARDPKPGQAVWWLRGNQPGKYAPTGGTSLEVKEKGIELPQLTYPLDLRGPHALFVNLPAKLGCIELRLSGDEYPQIFHSPALKESVPRVGEERFWRWVDMDRQHLIIRQPYRTVYEYEDRFRAHLDYVRLVPLTPEALAELKREWDTDDEKRLLAGYNEPYSWAFFEKLESPLRHWESVLPFAEAGVDLIDTQIGRGGCRMVFETRTGDQLLAGTYGDPVRGKVPTTDNVGQMQQYTNTLATQMKYARQLGMKFHANIGATNCYPGTPLESRLSQEHPKWRIGAFLDYEVPEVRQHILALFEEALQIGAGALSLDWCRYPNAVKDKETVTSFFRELRALADRYGEERKEHVGILTRFPAHEDPLSRFFDYKTWVTERLIDYLCPSLNASSRMGNDCFVDLLDFDLTRYVEFVADSGVKLLPDIHGGPNKMLPGIWFERVLSCYEAGADGVYIYQCDEPLHSSPETKRCVQQVKSLGALRRWRDRERAAQAHYSKGAYVTMPHRLRKGFMQVWTEGVEQGPVELLVDGVLRNHCERPPYLLTNDRDIEDGRHVLTVRIRDGGRWLEQDVGLEIHG